MMYKAAVDAEAESGAHPPLPGSAAEVKSREQHPLQGGKTGHSAAQQGKRQWPRFWKRGSSGANDSGGGLSPA